MVDFNFGILSISYEEITDFFKNVFKSSKVSDDPFRNISFEEWSIAMSNAVRCLFDDRILDDIGKGGWGLSDVIWVKSIYGNDVAGNLKDSVMSTVIAVFALRSLKALLSNSNSNSASTFLSKLSPVLYQELDQYICKRWNANYGWGGTLRPDREGKWRLLPSYRHTSFFLRLWLKDPRYASKIDITYRYLIDNYEEVDWQKEVVSTAVIAYHAFDEFYNSSAGIEHKAKKDFILNGLREHIISKFVYDRSGWTCESSEENKLVMAIFPYTFCVLIELFNEFNNKNELSRLMQRALDTTMISILDTKKGFAFSKSPNEMEPDFSTSCLALCALLRKPNKTNIEVDYLEGLLKYVFSELSENIPTVSASYLWPLSYMVEDVCTIFSSQQRMG